jgi:ariadne-1
MDSEDDMLYEDDSDHPSEQMDDEGDDDDNDDNDDFVDIGMDSEHNAAKHRNEDDEFPFEVLTTEQIVKHMVDCIKEVNTVVQV